MRKRGIVYALLLVIALRVVMPVLRISVGSQEEGFIKKLIRCIYMNLIN